MPSFPTGARKVSRVNSMPQAISTESAKSECTKTDEQFFEEIRFLDNELLSHFEGIIRKDPSLTRQIVSFQANKKRPFYRWYKYKEAFSAALVERFIENINPETGRVLDPFAGIGTTMFASAKLGFDSYGIELLPVGQEIIEARKNCSGPHAHSVLSTLSEWLEAKPWQQSTNGKPLNVLRITDGAYPEETLSAIENYTEALVGVSEPARQVLFFALLCILESISYTRKDGQYLRWDHRSNRRNGTNSFNKGRIYPFDEAIEGKINEIIEDLTLSKSSNDLFTDFTDDGCANISLLKGSCLDILPTLDECNFDAIVTSPPYCNRYDYTRTYALEHAALGVDEAQLVDLRQNMLSCTVENRAKELISFSPSWSKSISVCDDFDLLQAILSYLEHKKNLKELNNNGISRMVRGYFYEMACVIQECYRVLRAGGSLVMVNDNVRYAGISISVDLILSKIAESLGFQVKEILVLPQNKGNSSQQMGAHGRDALRKSVYIWEK